MGRALDASFVSHFSSSLQVLIKVCSLSIQQNYVSARCPEKRKTANHSSYNLAGMIGGFAF